MAILLNLMAMLMAMIVRFSQGDVYGKILIEKGVIKELIYGTV